MLWKRQRHPALESHLRNLSNQFPLTVSDDNRFVTVRDFNLPPGYTTPRTEVLITVPRDYPVSPPGIGGARVYLRPDLRFRGKKLRDLHINTTPGWGRWAWLCYERIEWHPHRDDLIKFLEMVRADLTDPPTEEKGDAPWNGMIEFMDRILDRQRESALRETRLTDFTNTSPGIRAGSSSRLPWEREPKLRSNPFSLSEIFSSQRRGI